MKKTLTILALTSAFAFTSCGDSSKSTETTEKSESASSDPKEALIDDAIELMKAGAKTVSSGDADAITKLQEKSKDIEERAKALGINLNDPSSLPDNLKKKFEDAAKEIAGSMMDKLPEGMADEVKEKAAEAMQKAMEGK